MELMYQLMVLSFSTIRVKNVQSSGTDIIVKVKSYCLLDQNFTIRHIVVGILPFESFRPSRIRGAAIRPSARAN